MRVAFEAEAARLAAVRRLPEEMAAIEEALEALCFARLSSAPADAEDMQFHRTALGCGGTCRKAASG